MTDYQVIIAGGGPVGVALAIELGMQNIKTLVLEKHAKPLRSPRAQSLSARSMEFFLRWGADQALIDALLLPLSLPQTGIWCTTLTGETYLETAWGDNDLVDNASPKAGVRVPLWVTEAVLQKRLADFPSVDFLRSCEVKDVRLNGDSVEVESYDKVNERHQIHRGAYLACCDGASGPTKRIFNNPFNPLSDETKMLSLLFIGKDIMATKQVPDGIMYFILAEGAMAFVGPIDLKEGLWHAQVVWNNRTLTPSDSMLSDLVDQIVGTPVQKEIVDFYFWDMQVQIADFFNFKNRVFWLGDSAHAFAPTGGLGLNTGFGDAQNLGWKLASVIREQAVDDLLTTYQMERHPVWLNNLHFARQNAEEFIATKKAFDPQKNHQAFARAYADLGTRYLHSSGLTLGYAYHDSPLTRLQPNQNLQTDPFAYTPKVEPGYFLPHVMHEGKVLYSQLSPTNWTLIVCNPQAVLTKEQLDEAFELDQLDVLILEFNKYPFEYLLIRPDWHIARVGNSLASVSGLIGECHHAF